MFALQKCNEYRLIIYADVINGQFNIINRGNHCIGKRHLAYVVIFYFRQKAGAQMKIKKTDYRKIYKLHYNIDFPNDYVVHHVDEDRENNDINNLLLLPLELHSKYHTYKQQYELYAKKGICFELSYGGELLRNMQFSYLDELRKVISEIQEWIRYKQLADAKISIYPMFSNKGC